MKRCSKFLRISAIGLGLAPVLFMAIQKLPAALLTEQNATNIEIDGINYGIFENIQGLDNFDSLGNPLNQDQRYATIKVRRDFVTDPSLYLWAKKLRSKKNQVLDIHVVTRNQEGETIKRQVLRSCQPLSWSVEAINPSLGGFNEAVDIAVQRTTNL